MLLREFITVANNQEMYIREITKLTGSQPVFHKNITSPNIPVKLLDRKIAYITPVPVERYERNSACFQILLEQE